MIATRPDTGIYLNLTSDFGPKPVSDASDQ